MSPPDAGARRLLRHPAGWLASAGGAGFSPFAPGTAGSAVALLPWWFLRDLGMLPWLALIAAGFALGVWASAVVVRELGLADPGVIVWDEVIGQWLSLLPLALAGLPPRATLAWMVAGFLLFRVFDVLKPGPVGVADRRVHGGLGVMLDDLLAGALAALVLAIALALLT